jgi:diadenosine tetraphosphatase ApaH/serine/threonine PP2A family protein phosphatase
MRALLVADIHSNRVAFHAVLEDARQRGGWDVVWSMGDIVGYGPEPGACIDLLGELGGVSVAGNHDWAVVEKVPLSEFNYLAAIANRWTAGQLSLAHRNYLTGLPLTLRFGDFTLVHGSPRDPIWEYLLDSEQALSNFAKLTTVHAAIGHSHVALAFRLEPEQGVVERLNLTDGQTLPLRDGRWIINPGSVGQPRDRDPRAAYAILDDAAGTVTAYRVAYDIAATQEKMAEAGLPTPLITRLSQGR